MTALELPATALDAALAYARHGWRVIPIKPGSKHPAGIPAWQEAATTDPATVRSWWTGLYCDHGVGIVTGKESGVWVLDVDVADDKRGDDTLAELEAAHGTLPDTVEAITGRRGRHLYFRWPGFEVSAGAAKRLGDGLDVRGVGGQVLAPPTIGPAGGPYSWVDGHEPETMAVADAPEWLLMIIAEPEVSTPHPDAGRALERLRATGSGPTESLSSTDSIAERFNADNAWSDLLTRDGWTLHHTDGDGEAHWTRPGKERRDGTSATTDWQGHDCLKVFTSSVPALDADRAYSKFGYEAATHYGGDRSAAAAEMRRALGGGEVFDPVAWIVDTGPASAEVMIEHDGVTRHGWEPTDLAYVLAADYVPPRPTIGVRSDGRGLFYRGRINALIGESGSGKSWVSQWAAAQVLNDGGAVLVVDLEDHAGSYVARLRGLGVAVEAIVERFVYVNPERSFNPLAAEWVVELVGERGIDLAVIDSTGEAMALDGAKPNDDDDTARWFRNLPRRVARLGPAVVLLDHLPKSVDAPAGFAIGSQRKRAAIDGASYQVHVGVAPVKGKEGHLRLVCAKDRSGFWQHGAKVADVVIVDKVGGVIVAVTKPSDVDRPTNLMERISRYLEENGDASRRQVEQEVVGNKAAKSKAVDVLVLEEWVELVPRVGRGGGFNLRSVGRYRDDEVIAWIGDEVPTTTAEPVDNAPANGTVPNSPQLSPDDLGAVPKGAKTELSPLPPALGTKQGRDGDSSVPSDDRGSRARTRSAPTPKSWLIDSLTSDAKDDPE